MTLGFIILPLALGAAGAATPATPPPPAPVMVQPQAGGEDYDCQHGTGDARVGACTIAIQSGRWSGPALGSVYDNRGMAYYDLGHYDLALHDFNEAVELSPASVAAHVNRALAYIKLKHYDEALVDLNAALQISPDRTEALNDRGLVYNELGKYDLALADLNRAVNLKPDRDIYGNRGNTYLKLGDYAQASADYGNALGFAPDDGDVFANRCRARALWGQELEQAAQDCTRALQILPESGRAAVYVSRGLLRLRQGDNQGAIADMTAVLVNDPHGAVPLYARGLAYLHAGNREAGEADIAAATAANPAIAARFTRVGLLP